VDRSLPLAVLIVPARLFLRFYVLTFLRFPSSPTFLGGVRETSDQRFDRGEAGFEFNDALILDRLALLRSRDLRSPEINLRPGQQQQREDNQPPFRNGRDGLPRAVNLRARPFLEPFALAAHALVQHTVVLAASEWVVIATGARIGNGRRRGRRPDPAD